MKFDKNLITMTITMSASEAEALLDPGAEWYVTTRLRDEIMAKLKEAYTTRIKLEAQVNPESLAEELFKL